MTPTYIPFPSVRFRAVAFDIARTIDVVQQQRSHTSSVTLINIPFSSVNFHDVDCGSGVHTQYLFGIARLGAKVK